MSTPVLAKHIEHWPVDALVPYSRNARTHSAAQIDQLVRSIQTFGFTNPILVDGAKGILAGHGRLKAAVKVGLERVPVIVLDHLTEAERRAYILADNKLAENAGWDEELLASELREIQALDFDLTIPGFDDAELKKLLGETEDPAADECPPVPEQAVTVAGDLWLLGRHRLLCGDATRREDVERLKVDEQWHLCFTSPPYNAGSYALTGNVKMKDKSSRYATYSDDLPEGVYVDLLCGFTDQALAVCDVVAVNMQQLANNKFAVLRWVAKFIDKFVDRAIWYKGHGNPAMAANVMASRFEDIWIFSSEHRPSRAIKTASFHGTVENVIESVGASAENDSQSIHAATMPMVVAKYAIESFSRPSFTIYDAFGGTGTTLIACEKTDRRGCLIEIEPQYCDVIVKRWQTYTGKQATRESDGRLFDELEHGALNAA